MHTMAYVAPTFVNGGPPALSAEVLNELAQAVEANETTAGAAQTAAEAAQATASAALPKSGGTLTGTVTANNNTDYTTPQVRNILASTVDLEAGVSELANGTIYFVYE